jgi:hypothetical protein
MDSMWTPGQISQIDCNKLFRKMAGVEELCYVSPTVPTLALSVLCISELNTGTASINNVLIIIASVPYNPNPQNSISITP